MKSFNIEKAILIWKNKLHRYKGLEDDFIEELECNLRDRIDDYISDGLNTKDAFELAVQKSISCPQQLEDQFVLAKNKNTMINAIKNLSMLLGSIPLNFRISYRNIQKYRLIFLINTIGLSLGASIAFLIFLTISYEKSFYDTLSTKEQVHQIVLKWPGNEAGNYSSSYVLPVKLKESFPEITSFTRMVNHSSFESSYFSYLKQNEMVNFNETKFYVADSTYFRMFPLEFKYGNANYALNDLNNIVLSEETAIKYFGDTNPIGNTLVYNDDKSFVVSGVVKVPVNIHERFEMLGRIDFVEPNKMDGWDNNGPSYIFTGPKTDLKTLKQKVAGFKITPPNKEDLKVSINLVPIGDINTYWDDDGLKKLGIIGLFILLIASLNYTNLSRALQLKKEKELCLKKIMGADWFHFIAQRMADSIILIACCMLVSSVVVYYMLPLFGEMLGLELKHFVKQDILASLLNISIIIVLCIFVSNVFIQSFKISSIGKSVNINNMTKGNRRSFNWSKVNIAVQFGISIFLLIGSIVVIKQRAFIFNTDLGIEYDNVLQIKSNPAATDKFDIIKTELEKHPSIKAISSSNDEPTNIDGDYFVFHERGTEKVKTTFNYFHVFGDFFETFKLDIIMGKPFPENSQTKNGFIINETGLKALNIIGDPIGKEIEFWGNTAPIIGVVKDFHNSSLYREIQPVIIISNDEYKSWIQHIHIKIDPNDVASTLNFIEQKIKEIVPNYPLDITLLDNEFDKRYSSVESMNKLFLLSSVLALLTSAIGLFGIVMFFIEKRTKEIAIRKISGAKVVQLTLLMIKDFSLWIMISFPLVCVLGWFVMKEFLQNFAYRTTLDWWVFALAGIIALGIGLLTVSYHTIRAALANPVHALADD